MSEEAEAKKAIANFFGFAMSKGNEIDKNVLSDSNRSRLKTNIGDIVSSNIPAIEAAFSAPQQPVPQVVSSFIPESQTVPDPRYYRQPEINIISQPSSLPDLRNDSILEELQKITKLLTEIKSKVNSSCSKK